MSKADQHADWLSVAAARDRILADIVALPREERPLLECLGAVLAEALVSSIDLPLWDNSAMDGFAVYAQDVRGASPGAPRTLSVAEDIAAGSFPSGPLRRGTACRVMTGAAVPAGADSVIRVEHTDGGTDLGSAAAAVRVLSDQDAGRNIRLRGEELQAGTRVVEVGSVVDPAKIGLAAALGYPRLNVVRRPRVALLSSGDELVDIAGFDEVRAGRRIVSSNSYALAAQLAECGVEVVQLGIAADSRESLREHLERARGCDALITSAGVSMGEHDLMEEVFSQLGLELAFWRVRMRPGSPLAYGRIADLGGIPWFGLPGNPVSAMVTFEVFARPALLRMAGRAAVFRPTVTARVSESVVAKSGLTHFLRALLSLDEEGTWHAHSTGPQSSGMLSSMAAADALLVVPEECDGLQAGDEVVALRLNARPDQREPGY